MTKLLTVNQAAEWLNVANATVYLLCQKNILPHARIGIGRGAIRISEDALKQYVDGATVQAESTPEQPSPPLQKLKHLRI